MLDEKITSDLKAKYGDDLLEISFDDGSENGFSLVFQKPKRIEYDRWMIRNDQDKNQAGRELAQACVVYPGVSEMFAFVEKFPAILLGPNGIIDNITELAGLGRSGVSATKKKL